MKTTITFDFTTIYNGHCQKKQIYFPMFSNLRLLFWRELSTLSSNKLCSIHLFKVSITYLNKEIAS